MSEDDDVVGSWTLDDATRLRIRTERIEGAIGERDWHTAIIEAEELLDDSPDNTQALLRLADATLEIPDAEGAAQAYEQYLRRVSDPEPRSLAGLAVARFELCELMGCIEVAREALRRDPEQPTASYYLSLALERTDGPGPESQAAFEVAHTLDPTSFPRPISLADDQWTRVVEEAAAQLHPTLRAFWSGVPLHLGDLPELELLRKSDPPITPTVTALYEGSPPEGDATESRPTRLVLYRRNLRRVGTIEGVTREVHRALEGEALHWLGWTADDLP